MATEHEVFASINSICLPNCIAFTYVRNFDSCCLLVLTRILLKIIIALPIPSLLYFSHETDHLTHIILFAYCFLPYYTGGNNCVFYFPIAFVLRV